MSRCIYSDPDCTCRIPGDPETHSMALDPDAGASCDGPHWTEDIWGNETRIDCGNGCEY